MLKAVTNLVNVSQIVGVLPVVNGGTGVTTSTGTGNTVLSAAPTLSGNVSLSTGNLVIRTSGQGIDFSATPGTGTSELLADYEEGTWTPSDQSGSGLSLTGVSGTYTKVGRLVTVVGAWTYPATASAANAVVGGLPYTVGVYATGSILSSSAVTGDNSLSIVSTTNLYFYGASFTRRTNVNYSGLSFYFTATYFV